MWSQREGDAKGDGDGDGGGGGGGDTFKNSLFVFLTALGGAVGTGNIWRFSRIVAQNAADGGSGCFLLVWLLFLVTWAIPIVIAEYAAGRKSRHGVIYSFEYFLGHRWSWMGTGIVLVNVLITCYYAVLTGYCFFYFIHSMAYVLPDTYEVALTTFDDFTGSGWPVLCTFVAIAGACLSLWKGVKSLERVNFFIVPALLLIIVVMWIRAMVLGTSGIRFFFNPDPNALKNPKMWLDALTQEAFDTGAGWGWILTVASFMKTKHSVTQFGTWTPLCNNIVSLLSGMTMFSITFALLDDTDSTSDILGVMRDAGTAGTGLTFIWIPKLLSEMALGRLIAVFFFLGLACSSFSSLLSLYAVPLRCGMDYGFKKMHLLVTMGVVSALLSLPSALSSGFLANQDFVWGSALMFTGGAFAFLIIRTGVDKFRRNIILQTRSDRLGRWWNIIIQWVVPLEVICLVAWWIVQSIVDSGEWYNPARTESLMTCIIQWGLMSALIYGVDRFFASKRRLPMSQTLLAEEVSQSSPGLKEPLTSHDFLVDAEGSGERRAPSNKESSRDALLDDEDTLHPL